MMKLTWSICCFLLLLGTSARAQESDLESLLDELQQSARQTDTLNSDFVQEKHLSIFAEKLVSQGRFIYRKPDNLHWELLAPAQSGFILQGERGVRWSRLSGEVTGFTVNSDPIMGMIAQQLLAWAQVDIDWIVKRYSMELLSTSPVILKLLPRDPGEAGFINYLQIRFATGRSYVDQVQMVEQGGDSTILRFSNATVNGTLPIDAFSVPEL